MGPCSINWIQNGACGHKELQFSPQNGSYREQPRDLNKRWSCPKKLQQVNSFAFLNLQITFWDLKIGLHNPFKKS